MADLSFELLHLISALLGRFNSILKECKLDIQQIYLLAYFGSYGTTNSLGQKMLLRLDATVILKEVFKCSDTQVSIWVHELKSKKYLGEISLNPAEKLTYFPTRKGKKALVIKPMGVAKVSLFVKKLEKLRDDVTSDNSKLLIPPGVQSVGLVAEGLQNFVSFFKAKLEASHE